MTTVRSQHRKDEILQALAMMLEQSPGQRITTAALAAKVGVSEAALYRHFPSKARMFEGLLEFIEQSFAKTIEQILKKQQLAEQRVQLILEMLLTFAEKNPGLCRLLSGDALHGEQERLQERVSQLFIKLEQHIRWCLRERKLREGKAVVDEAATANFLLASCQGKIHQYVSSGFTKKPCAQFPQQWALLKRGLFPDPPA